MKKQKLDSLFKKAINESNDFYDNEANLARERIWNNVKSNKHTVPLFYKMLAVASIMLLICLSVLTYSNLQSKINVNKLVEANNELMKDNQILKSTIKNTIANSKTSVDTIFIEKRISQSKPIIKTQYIKDTIYLKEVVYVEKDKNPDLLTLNDKTADSNIENRPKANELISTTEVSVNNSNGNTEGNFAQDEAITSISNTDIDKNKTYFQKDIIIKNNDAVKKKKRRKFRIKFGGRHSKTDKEALAISTSFKN